ncbi:MAG: M14 family zinc carboxypeptidase [Flavobacteriaceae bacterium]
MKKITLLFVLLLLNNMQIMSQNNRQKAESYLSEKGEVCFIFKANSIEQFKELSSFLSLGHKQVDKNTLEAEAYANQETFNKFLSYNIPFTVNATDNEFRPHESPSYNPQAWDTTWDEYPTYSQYVAKMNYYATTYPTLCSLETIGTTSTGRELLMLKISDNVSTNEAEPEFMYTSSMHGDELAGYPLMIRLIDYLLTNYGSDAEVDNIVNSTVIYINPLANPDGAYRTAGNDIISNPRRGNANNQDLNRNFPDNVAGLHYSSIGNVYEIETESFMKFEQAHDIVLSANFHGGTELVNYPYDNAYTAEYTHADTDYYEYISVEYATNAQNNSPAGYMIDDDDWDGSAGSQPWQNDYIQSPGVTHGAEWYRVYGGRQDYMNFYRHSKEVTIELSDVKWINGNQLPNHWNYNRQAFLDYMKQVNFGFQGIVSDESGNPVVAKISIAGHDALNSWGFSNEDLGDYYRLIKAGTYTVTYEAPGYVTQNINVTVTDNTKTVQNVTMIAVTPTPTASDDQLCDSGSVALTATGSGTLNWYTNIDDTVPVYTGATYNTPTISSTTTYYVEDVVAKANVGDANSNSGGGFLDGQRYLIFDCSESVLLREVTINANGPGEMEVQLQDSSGNMLDSRVIIIDAAGVQTIPLDFVIPVGTDMRLASHEISTVDLYRTLPANTNFPYTNGSITIKNGSAANYYYFFYDWVIQDYKSARKAVTVTVDPSPTADFTYVVNPANNGEVTFTNTSADATSYAWDFGDASGTSTDTNPVYTFASTGVYNVELTSTNAECGDDITVIQVSVTVDTLGIDDNELSEITVFPNPFKNTVTIDLPNTFNTDFMDVELFDLRGRKISTTTFISDGNSIKLDHLNTLSVGTYLLKIYDKTTSKQIVKKLIKN